MKRYTKKAKALYWLVAARSGTRRVAAFDYLKEREADYWRALAVDTEPSYMRAIVAMYNHHVKDWQ